MLGVIFCVVVFSIFLYVLGILISKKLRRSNNDILVKYGSPSFLVAGIKEYKFVFDFILFSGYKKYSLEDDILKLIMIYKFVLFFLLVSFSTFMVFLVRSNNIVI